jgi:hypothetical protein
MGNFSPVFLKCRISTRLGDVVELSMKLTVDSLIWAFCPWSCSALTNWVYSVRMRGLYVWCGRFLRMWCVYIFHNYDFINDILLRYVTRISESHPVKTHFISRSVILCACNSCTDLDMIRNVPRSTEWSWWYLKVFCTNLVLWCSSLCVCARARVCVRACVSAYLQQWCHLTLST